jgi:hypothetical protein
MAIAMKTQALMDFVHEKKSQVVHQVRLRLRTLPAFKPRLTADILGISEP